LEAKSRHEIARLLPEVLDSLVASMESGAGFDHAAWTLSKTSDDALAREFVRYLQDVRQGKLRREALLDVARRIDVPEVTTFVQVVIQSDQLGVRLVDVLRTLSARLAVLSLPEQIAVKIQCRDHEHLVFVARDIDLVPDDPVLLLF